MKTLIFERAGIPLSDMNDVGTGRIRTAFRAKDGNNYYLEMIAIRKGKYTQWCRWERAGFIDSCYLMDGNTITKDYIKHPEHESFGTFEWTRQSILNMVNSIGGDFDEVRIADPEEYRVFKNSEGNCCNFGIEYSFDEAKNERN